MSVRLDSTLSGILRLTASPDVPFTLMGWFYIHTLPVANGVLLGHWNGGTLKILSTGVLQLRTSGGTGDGSATLSTGTWYHLTLTRAAPNADTGLFHVHIDGSATPDIVRSDYHQDGDLIQFSDYWDGTNLADISLAKARLWASVLDDAEIAAEYASATPVKASPWATWPLAVHTDITDDSGNGRNLTSGGTISTNADNPTFGAAAQPSDSRQLPRGRVRGLHRGLVSV